MLYSVYRYYILQNLDMNIFLKGLLRGNTISLIKALYFSDGDKETYSDSRNIAKLFSSSSVNLL